jgi:peptide/nickel transport system permease protein
VSRYLFKRFAYLLLTLLLSSLVIFVMTQLLPGDVARVILGREASDTAIESLRTRLGLDRPAVVRYLSWLGNFVMGDWGESFGTGGAIRPLVLERLGNSLMLAGLAVGFAVPAAVLLGVAAALNRDRPLDTIISVGSLAVVGLPEFVTGLLLIQVFSFELGVLPASSSIRPGSGFLEALPMLVLPALTATLVLLAYIARMTRASVIEELARPYVRTAILKGITRREVVLRHVLRNALLPTITVVAISLGWLVSGLIVVENVFNYPGLGRLLTFAIDRRDFPLLQAIALVAVVGFAVSNMLADILYTLLDPRIRYR